jgi:ssRNA-specific RNase YbeY (16S rRNA maturation enzyme)
LEEELVRLCIHGVLHVLGYDHGDHGEGEQAMPSGPLFTKQETLVREVMTGAGLSPARARSSRKGE